VARNTEKRGSNGPRAMLTKRQKEKLVARTGAMGIGKKEEGGGEGGGT